MSELLHLLGITCAKYYENPTMLSRVTAKNVGDAFLETQCNVQQNQDQVTLRYLEELL